MLLCCRLPGRAEGSGAGDAVVAGGVLRLVGMGFARYVYALPRIPICPSGFVTTTLTVPAACAGVTTVISAFVTDWTRAAVPPICTIAPARK